MVCPIPEDQFESYLKKLANLNQDEKKKKYSKDIDVKAMYPLMIPFSIKKHEFDVVRNNSINVHAQIHLGPNQLREIKNLYNLVKGN